MLKLALIISLILPFAASPVTASNIAVKLQSPPATGTVVLALFSSASAFGDFGYPARLEAYTLDGPDSYVLTDIPPGEYALLAFYDENDNREIDKSFIGIPIERLGFSNNYRPKVPPSYTRAAFTLAQDERHELTVALNRPPGKRGLVGLGVGAIGRSSSYWDCDGGVTQVIPAITYNGDRLQALGPNVSYGIAGTGRLSDLPG